MVTFFKTVFAFLKAFPELVALLNTIARKIREGQIKAEVNKSIRVINEAFDEKDTKKLDDLFKF